MTDAGRQNATLAPNSAPKDSPNNIKALITGDTWCPEATAPPNPSEMA